jgi:hypothetical protein
MEMGDIDHTNPHTDEPFVETFRRGQVVAADGGERDAADDVGVEDDLGPEEEGPETMKDVAHDSPTDGAKRTFERGNESRDESV